MREGIITLVSFGEGVRREIEGPNEVTEKNIRICREFAKQECRPGTGDDEVERISHKQGLKFATLAASF